MTHGSTDNYTHHTHHSTRGIKVQIEKGQYYLAQDGRSVVCAVAPATELMVRTLPEPMQIMGAALGAPLIPPEIAERHRDDWGIAVIRGGHGDSRYKGWSTRPERSFFVGPGARISAAEKIETEEDKEGLEKMMSLYPAKRVSVRWEKADKFLADVEAGEFVRTANGSICVSAMSAATKDDLKQEDSVARLGDFCAFVVCGGIGLENSDPEGYAGTQITINAMGDLAGRYRRMAESADGGAQADYIRAIKEDMRPVCIVRPVVVDPETN